MKNVLLMIVLGLFAVGCLDQNYEGILAPEGSCEDGFCEKWECPTTGYIYNDEDVCEEECLDYE
tara:strand:+ start:494 stop:685 length:192 start_codon:yes stop_codon:yes gene_type:complete